MANSLSKINGVDKWLIDGGVIQYFFPEAFVFVDTVGESYSTRHNRNTVENKTVKFADITDKKGAANVEEYVDKLAEEGFFFASNPDNPIYVNPGKNELSFDAWGRPKSVIDRSILHGMFTFGIPVQQWYELNNGVEQAVFNNCTSESGALVVRAGATLNDDTILRTFRNPRYQPNRGYLYSTAAVIDNPTATMNRRFGVATDENGAFFSLESGVLYGVVRYTNGGAPIETKIALDTEGINLSKGNIFDIQFQWRGVGNYVFFINLKEVGRDENLGSTATLTMANPALPMFFEAENLGDNDAMRFGCVDVSSEGGEAGNLQYGSVSISNNNAEVSVSGLNQPIIAIRSKLIVNSRINTRDSQALAATAYADNKSIFRVWVTRDFSAITENNQVWKDFGDGHLEYLEYNNPVVGTPMTFDTTKARVQFSSRVNTNETFVTSAQFLEAAKIWLSPGDMFVFTMHRENAAALLAGVVYEFTEDI
jgi:hypothetical protein